jgi:hypothetical protein
VQRTLMRLQDLMLHLPVKEQVDNLISYFVEV